jgi:hypothetical protein
MRAYGGSQLKKNVRALSFVLSLLAIPVSGCSPTARGNIGAVAAGAAQGAGATETGTGKLMIFGGADHKTYLGCLNCSQYTADSIFNEYGQHGSRYSSESIWNQFAEYGSAYSQYGACNAYATDPPVIVDGSGKYYGRLTLNQYHPELGAGASYYNWLQQSVCADH